MKKILINALSVFALTAILWNNGWGQKKSNDTSRDDDDGAWFNEFHANPGAWNAIIRNDKVYMEFAGFHWNEQRSFETAELGALPVDKTGSFTLKRDAGTIVFTGVFSGNRGQGTYSFEEDPAFKTYLAQQGFASVNEELMLHLCFTNINKEYFEYLRANHYEGITMHQLKDLAEQNINKHVLEDYLDLFQKENYGKVSIDKIIELREHGVTARFVNGFHEMGYKNISLEKALELRDHGVTPKFITEFKDMGVKDLSLDEALELRDHGVSVKFINGFHDLGFKDISVEKAREMRDHGVSPEFIKEFQEIGFKDISLDRAKQLRDHGVTAEFITRMQKKGLNNLSLEEYERLRDSGM